jgi:signal transduction histidine kinase/ligand-binding sensor domain-containing protein
MALAAAGLLGVFAPAFSGTALEQSLAQMDHAMWTARDGAPQGILALAQAADGTLWIGSEAGLFNFDGLTFSAFKSLPGEPQLPAEPVYSICVSKDGALWVGFLQAGTARITHGRVELYPKVDKEPLGLVQNLTQAADGSIWGLSNYYRLVRFGADYAWHVEQTPMPGTRIGRFFIDSSDTLWVPLQGNRLYRRSLGQSAYTATDVETGIAFGFAETRDGSIWMTDVIAEIDRGRAQHFDHLGHHLLTVLPDDTSFDILYSPDDTVLLATQGNGLHRFTAETLAASPSQGQLKSDVFTRMDGLTSDEVHALLLDADGNMWAGGRRGLDRFRRAQLVRFVPRKPSVQWGVCASNQGPVWIAALSDQLYKLSGGTTIPFPEVHSFNSLFCAKDGDVWLVGGPTGIWHLHENNLEPVPYVTGIVPYGVLQVVATSDHTLYATIGGSAGGGYWQYKNNVWTKIVHEGLLGKAGWVEYIDSQDQLWMGRRDGVVTLPLEGRVLRSGDPGLGIVRAMLETTRGMFATGTNGIAVLREERFQMLAFADEASARGITGIIESNNGDLWLNASHGIVRVGASELDIALRRPDYRMKSDRLTEGDFVGAPQGVLQFQTAARDPDGNLWFVTVNGVIHIDPQHWRADSRPPIVSIKSISVDYRPLGHTAFIGPRPQALEIRYFGVNLTAPEQVIYRYRLDGFDDAWQDVGHRTEAIYTRLPAGTYTFRVIASNGNGAWTAPVSTAAFTVLPSFYQTTWFAAICICTALIIIWLVFRTRLRAITREVRARADERADERIRIARELHDTLLQGIQGLLLTFHVAAQKLSPDDDSKMMLEKALSTADRIIIEGRNRVNSLRSEHLTEAELIGSLENVGKELKLQDGIQFQVKRTGIAATLHAHVADEIFSIAREALTNAFRHSHASRISLELTYGTRYFSMRCSDNGRGFASEDQEKPGHWGLKGIFERAQRLGGQLRCRSNPTHGTEILCAIPSYRAYKSYSRVMFYLRAHHMSERNPINSKKVL